MQPMESNCQVFQQYGSAENEISTSAEALEASILSEAAKGNKRRDCLKFKPSVSGGIQKPKEILLIQGRDPDCRQKITFNQEVDPKTYQQAGTGLQQGLWKPHRQDLAVGKEPPLMIPSSGVPTSKNERESSEDEEELARDRKKPKVFQQRRYQKTEDIQLNGKAI